MALTNAERQARWRTRRQADIEARLSLVSSQTAATGPLRNVARDLDPAGLTFEPRSENFKQRVAALTKYMADLHLEPEDLYGPEEEPDADGKDPKGHRRT
jgi:hypothetical protein